MKNVKVVLLFFIILAIVSSVMLLVKYDSGNKDVRIVISEVMSSNKVTLADEDGEYSDWLELHNTSDTDINIKGYSITDNVKNYKKWSFPDLTIKADEYLIVFASGKDKVEEDGRTCHTNFKLSAAGVYITLSSVNTMSIDSMDVPELQSDVSYGIVQDGSEEDGKPAKLFSVTPGNKNSGKRADDALPPNTADQTGEVPQTGSLVGTGEILINEYMPRNSHTIYDEFGSFSDWVELYNTTDSDINLSGYCLSTDIGNLKKWQIPNITIAAKGYVLIWCSGKDQLTQGGQAHANIKLGESDTAIVLSTQAGTIIDSVVMEHTNNDVSKGRSTADPNKWVYFSKATPGEANTTVEYEQLAAAVSLRAKGLWVSEAFAASVPYNDKQVSDWIEIYNGTNEAVNLNGYGLSVDLKDKYAYKFGDRRIQPGEYLVVYATGTNVPSKYASKLHADFTLSTKGETIYLTDNNGFVLDAFDTGRVSLGYTSGRSGNEEPSRYFFMEATPGTANASGKYITYTAKPSISNEGGYVASGTAISLTSVDGADIYYTTDGTEPSAASKRYTGNITVSANTVVKAKAVKDGMLPSDTVTATYIVGKTHSIPFVSISLKPDDFYGSANGIYANKPGYTDNIANFPYTKANFGTANDWERKMTFEYFDGTGKKQVEFDAGLKIFGQYSRGYPQKSMSVHMRGDYGYKSVTYPFFENNSITTMSNFVLRAGGQDYKQTIIRDPFCAQVMKGNTTAAIMDWQPVALYINGEYFGYYTLREKINESYLASHYGIDENNVDIIKGNNNALSGTFDNYQSLLTYVSTHDLSKDEYYKVVEGWVDIDNFIDYLISQIFFDGQDTGNVKFYRERKEGAKWQWVLFDFDQALRNDWPNSIGKIFDPAGHGHNKAFKSTLQVNLLKNSTFKNKLIERYAYHLNSTFMPDRLIGILEGMTAKIDGEIADECARWGWPVSYNEWSAHVRGLKTIVTNRRKIAAKEFKAFFNLTDARMNELVPGWNG